MSAANLMKSFEGIREILSEILDVEENRITPETYLVRDLDAESIDLLELAVAINKRFGIEVKDEEIFLIRLRRHLKEAQQKGVGIRQYLSEQYPALKRERIEEILADLEEGPVLKVEDLVSYVDVSRSTY